MIQFMQSIHFFDRLLERFTTLSNSLLKFERRYTEVVISNGMKWIFLIEMKKINLNVTVIDQMKNIFIPVEQLPSDVSFEISIYAIVFGPNLINHSSSLQIKNAFSNLPSNCPFPILLMESHIYLKYKIIEIMSQQYECVIPANKIMYHIDSDGQSWLYWNNKSIYATIGSICIQKNQNSRVKKMPVIFVMNSHHLQRSLIV
jgi:hypothetical protein